MEGYPTRSSEGGAVDLRERRPLEGIPTRTLDGARTVNEAVESIVQLHPDFVGLRCLSAERVEEAMSLGDLWSRARRFQAHFIAAGAEPDRILILAMSTGPDLVAAYIGALLAGGVPGLVASPTNRFADRQRYAERVTDILRNSGARVLCCDDGARALFTEVAEQRGAPISILSPGLMAEPIAEAPIVPRGPDDLASIQYSSGTTAAPKGVLLTHGAIVENLRAMRDAIRLDSRDVSVNWIPLYHDMGLIGASLLPLVTASPTVLIPTMAFMKEPALWLWAVHHYGGTISWAPNFAYTICAQRVPPAEVDGVDLATWRIAIIGAEPTLPDTLTAFRKRYAANGFRPETFISAWGLAENVLMSTCTPLGTLIRVEHLDRAALVRDGIAKPTGPDGVPVVSVGRPIVGNEVEARDDSDRSLPERHIGELYIRSQSMFVGYQGQADVTAMTLRDGWLDTGDKGFIADGEVFFLTRRKDIIIIGGEKHVPHDVELAIQEVPGVRAGCVVAFGALNAEHGTEELAAVVETKESDTQALAELRKAISSKVLRTTGLLLRHLLLVPPGGVEKTTSGKLARLATRERYAKEIERLQAGEVV